MRQNCIVFDLDETLISTLKRQFLVIKNFFESKKIEFLLSFGDYLKIRKSTKKSNLDIFRFLNYVKLDEREFQVFFSHKIEDMDYLLLDELIINLELLEKVKFQKDHKLILLSLRSNCENSTKQLKNLFLYDFFDEIYFEKHASNYNPKTNLLRKIQEKHAEIQFLGDSKSDLEATYETSIDFIKVNTGLFDFNFTGESFADINLLLKAKYGIQ